MNDSQIAPGWYLTASGAHERFHDGTSWTEHVRPASQPGATLVEDQPGPAATVEPARLPASEQAVETALDESAYDPFTRRDPSAIEDVDDESVGSSRSRLALFAVGGVAALVLAFIGSYFLLMRGADAPVTAPPIEYKATHSPVSNNNAEQMEIEASAGATQSPERNAVIKGDGVYEVGPDIKPGTTLVDSGNGSDCTWSRLKKVDATAADVIATGHSARPVVTIGKSDGAFQSFACGFWVPVEKYEPPVDWKKDVASFDGTYLVGTDLTPGTYKSNFKDVTGASCAWRTLSGFTGTEEDTLTSGTGKKDLTVTIGSDAKGFTTSGCGTWTKTD